MNQTDERIMTCIKQIGELCHTSVRSVDPVKHRTISKLRLHSETVLPTRARSIQLKTSHVGPL